MTIDSFAFHRVLAFYQTAAHRLESGLVHLARRGTSDSAEFRRLEYKL